MNYFVGQKVIYNGHKGFTVINTYANQPGVNSSNSDKVHIQEDNRPINNGWVYLSSVTRDPNVFIEDGGITRA